MVKPGVDVLICNNMVGILFGGKRLHKDCIAAVQGGHDILVATARARWEKVNIISEQAGYRYVKEGELWKGGGWRNAGVNEPAQ